jgi:hypothetical protein
VTTPPAGGERLFHPDARAPRCAAERPWAAGVEYWFV